MNTRLHLSKRHKVDPHLGHIFLRFPKNISDLLPDQFLHNIHISWNYQRVWNHRIVPIPFLYRELVEIWHSKNIPTLYRVSIEKSSFNGFVLNCQIHLSIFLTLFIKRFLFSCPSQLWKTKPHQHSTPYLVFWIKVQVKRWMNKPIHPLHPFHQHMTLTTPSYD